MEGAKTPLTVTRHRERPTCPLLADSGVERSNREAGGIGTDPNVGDHALPRGVEQFHFQRPKATSVADGKTLCALGQVEVIPKAIADPCSLSEDWVDLLDIRLPISYRNADVEVFIRKY